MNKIVSVNKLEAVKKIGAVNQIGALNNLESVNKIGAALAAPILFIGILFCSRENRQNRQLAAQNKVTFFYFYVAGRV